MLLARTRIVLVQPSLPENVGSVARAMGHFGLDYMIVVGGVAPTHERARVLSAGHDAILEDAAVVETLDEALAGASLVVGTTARAQATVDRVAIAPAQAASLAAAHAEGSEIALVFGPEKHGLSNAELRRCHQLVTIPGAPEACLNLAQAAAVLFHAWFTAERPDGLPVTALADEAGLADVAAALAELLAARGLIKPRELASKLHTLRRILSRTALTPDEAALVGGWLHALNRA